MSNKEFFDWMYERLIYVYKEGSNIDFVQSFKKRTDWLIQNTIGWISVKDRLPDTTDYMFTCIEMNGRPQCVGFHYYKDGKWFEGFEEDTVGAVEYWMPIPKLPKEEEK